MTPERFDQIQWFSGMTAQYLGTRWDVLDVDFSDRTVGLVPPEDQSRLPFRIDCEEIEILYDHKGMQVA